MRRTLLIVAAAIITPSISFAGECAQYGKQVESLCLSAAKQGNVRDIKSARLLCRDSKASAVEQCKDEFRSMSRYFKQSVASKGYHYTRCEYWGWMAQQVVYWKFLEGREGKYMGLWDTVAQPIYEHLPAVATNDCKRKL